MTHTHAQEIHQVLGYTLLHLATLAQTEQGVKSMVETQGAPKFIAFASKEAKPSKT